MAPRRAMKGLAALLAAAVLAMPGSVAAQDALTAESAAAFAAEAFGGAVASGLIPGAAVAIVKGNETVLLEAWVISASYALVRPADAATQVWLLGRRQQGQVRPAHNSAQHCVY